VGQRFGRYRLYDEIGAGGMASVHVARLLGPVGFCRTVAVKRLRGELLEDPELFTMFLDEARLAARIQHPNVVQVLDVVPEGKEVLLVMEYVKGDSLARLLGVPGTRAPLPVYLAILTDVLHGLHAAHEATSERGEHLRIVHRDVSPHNILVGSDGIARVTDFGIAKALGRLSRTSTGILKGKLGYMSPEQLRFRPPDRRSDLFSLGVVLFELLTAQRLYPGKLGEESALRILEEPAPDLLEFRDDAPPELVGLMFKLLAKDPDQRPADARSVANSLETILLDLVAAGERTDTSEYLERLFGEERQKLERELAEALAALEAEPVEAAPPSSKARVTSTPPRNRRVLAVAAGIALLGLGAAGWKLRGNAETPASERMGTAIGRLTSSTSPLKEAEGTGEREPSETETTTRGQAPKGRATRASQRAPRSRGRDSREDPVRLWDWK